MSFIYKGIYTCIYPCECVDAGALSQVHVLCDPLQCSCLKNSIDRGAWRATVHGVTKS